MTWEKHTIVRQKAAHYAFEEEIPDINLFRPGMTNNQLSSIL
jgi:hypothetical protein